MELFDVSREDVPVEIGAACCAQFVVSRDQIRLRARADYIRMRNWIFHSDLDSHGIGNTPPCVSLVTVEGGADTYG